LRRRKRTGICDQVCDLARRLWHSDKLTPPLLR